MRPVARILQSNRGAELVEMALVLPLLLLLFAGIVDFGFAFQRYLVLTNAAREGARIAALPDYSIPQDVVDRVTSYVRTGLNDQSAAPVVTTATVTPALPGGGSWRGVTVTVQLTNNYLVLGPVARLFGAGASFTSVQLTAVATMRAEVGS